MRLDHEIALDELSDFVSGVDHHLWDAPERKLRLADAYALTVTRDDLQSHELTLAELAAERMVQDAERAEWETLGGS